MPYVDGHTLLTQIQRYAGGTYLPVLVLTADTTSDGARSGARPRRAGLSDQARRCGRSHPAHGQPAADAPAADDVAADRAIRRRTSVAAAGSTTPNAAGAPTRPARAAASRPIFRPVVDVNTLQIVGHEGAVTVPGRARPLAAAMVRRRLHRRPRGRARMAGRHDGPRLPRRPAGRHLPRHQHVAGDHHVRPRTRAVPARCLCPGRHRTHRTRPDRGLLGRAARAGNRALATGPGSPRPISGRAMRASGTW